MNDDFITIYNTGKFNEQKIEDFFRNGFDSRLITDFSWTNNDEINFKADYGKCADSKTIKISWFYNVTKKQMKRLKSEIKNRGIVDG